jgi:hypothetical protein
MSQHLPTLASFKVNIPEWCKSHSELDVTTTPLQVPTTYRTKTRYPPQNKTGTKSTGPKQKNKLSQYFVGNIPNSLLKQVVHIVTIQMVNVNGK